MAKKTHISIRHIAKVFPDGTKALSDINLEIAEGEIVVLLGPSGCGKSTLLRTIGGLEEKSGGEIYFYDKEISKVPVEKRNVGFVFQNYALFPTMTVRKNIAFGLQLRRLDKHEINRRVDKLLEMMELTAHADKKPKQLSGGQQQRVAIARVLAIQPDVLLLDEPLTALDAKLKEHLRGELALMLRRLGITTIYVTHDQLEAMAIADRIAIMNHGVIEQVGTPEQIYSSPKTEFVVEFIGRINHLKGIVESRENTPVVNLGFVTLPIPGAEAKAVGEEVIVYLRPEDVTLGRDETKIGHNYQVVHAVVEQCVFMGGCCQVVVKIGECEIFFEADNLMKVKAGDVIRIGINTEKLIML